jgi:hypothetical protein
MWFEGTGVAPIGRVKAECDGLSVLVGHVEGVAQIHEEPVAAPPEAALDVRDREQSTMEEVDGSDTNGVAGPCTKVLVPCGDVEHFVRNMTQKDGNLGDCDESAFSCGGVAVHRGGAVGGRVETPHLPDNVEASLSGAHPVRVRTVPVGEGLSIVIVLLLVESEKYEGDGIVGHGVNIMDVASGGGPF